MLENSTRRTLARAILSLSWILVVVTGWVVGLSLIFLATGWSRWAFYLAVIGGTLAFVQLFDPWSPADDAAE